VAAGEGVDPPVVEPEVVPVPVEDEVVLLGVVDGIHEASKNSRASKYLKSMVFVSRVHWE
jgi:hypothetical protein